MDTDTLTRWAAQDAAHAEVDATFRPEYAPRSLSKKLGDIAIDQAYADKLTIALAARGL